MIDIQALVLGIRKECSWRKLAGLVTQLLGLPHVAGFLVLHFYLALNPVVPGLAFDRRDVRLHQFLDAIKRDNFTLECMLCTRLQW